MKIGGFAAAVAAVLLIGSQARAETEELAPGAKVYLKPEKSVYNANDSDPVKFTLKNDETSALFFSTVMPWSVKSGTTVVFMPYSGGLLSSLGAGQAKTWSWDRRDMNGAKVGAGTYKIKVYFSMGSVALTKSVFVAITPNGLIAGVSRFPLSVGNQWIYGIGNSIGNPGYVTETSEVTAKSGGDWYKVKGLVGAARWAKLSGATFPKLFVLGVTGGSAATPRLLFGFNRPLGYSYTINVPGTFIQELEVGETNETVVTNAGTFTGCYRLDAMQSFGTNSGYSSFWFARGIGLVQYGKVTLGGTKLYRLHSARVQSWNGKFYSIGQQ